MYCVGFLLIVLALEVEFSCLDLLRFSSDETRTFYIFTIIISIYRYVLMEVPHTRESLFTHRRQKHQQPSVLGGGFDVSCRDPPAAYLLLHNHHEQNKTIFISYTIDTMSGLITAAISGIAWCFCTASASLCSSWCGNDKPSTIPPSASSGRKRSVLLLTLSVVVALIFQYAVAPQMQPDQTAANAPKIGEYLVNAWTDGCADENNPDLVQVCSGNSGVYRASSAAFAFFCIFGVAAKCRPTANREAWPAKYVLFLFLCIGSVFISNDPLFIPIYLNVARTGSAMFTLFQQLILVDIAFNWNESWLAKADQAEIDEGAGKGRKWLAAILASCAILYIGSIAGIIIMYVVFGGCSTNDAFISITLVMSVICTVVQLTKSETGSLLTSAFMTMYATYLCGTAVSKNPNSQCNPKVRSLVSHP